MRKILFTILTFSLIFPGCSKIKEPPYPDEPKIVVLLYHKIAEGEADNLYERSRIKFENDLKYLISNNISVIDFNDLEKIKQSGKMSAGHSAIITFDDGDRSWYDIAVPLLKRNGMKATFCLWVEKMGSNSFLTWQEVQYISNITYDGGIKPFVFGSHSYSHQFLMGAKGNFATPGEYNVFLNWELLRSKEVIEEHSPLEVQILALPYGDGAGDNDIITAAQHNGYKFIRTSRNAVIGSIPGLDLFNIPVLPMLDVTESDEIGYYLNN
jgi:peptidoglycan/xylan/chitin deacetylase (PgdA/CDA1 family)